MSELYKKFKALNKESENKHPERFNNLLDITNIIEKQKTVANELDRLINEQEKEKKAESGTIKTKQKVGIRNLIELNYKEIIKNRNEILENRKLIEVLNKKLDL